MQEYQRIVKNQSTRLRLLKYLEWIPDEMMLRLQYAIKHRRWLELRRPQRFTEWLQWYKINHRDPAMTICADKIAVRDYIRDQGYAHLLTDLYATATSASELDLDGLPEKFVVKTNNGSGTNIIVENKAELSPDFARQLTEWLERDYFAASREWAYKEVPPRILVEQYLEDPKNTFSGINDYKFFCFGGSARYILLAVDRAAGQKFNMLTTEWEDTGVGVSGTPNIAVDVPRPENLGEMINIAEELSSRFPFVRVDLYYVAGKIYFGEMTFYPASGYIEFDPDSFDFELGELWPEQAG